MPIVLAFLSSIRCWNSRSAKSESMGSIIDCGDYKMFHFKHVIDFILNYHPLSRWQKSGCALRRRKKILTANTHSIWMLKRHLGFRRLIIDARDPIHWVSSRINLFILPNHRHGSHSAFPLILMSFFASIDKSVMLSMNIIWRSQRRLWLCGKTLT